jgi:hypothetical protein
LGLRHSLHRKVGDAPGFYAFYAVLIAVAAVIVILPGAPLGLLTNAVQVLAGVLLPSATVFLLLLSNDRALLGPWTNTKRTNVFTGVVVAALVMLSIILTASVVIPSLGTEQILWILGAGTLLALGVGVWMTLASPGTQPHDPSDRARRDTWRMPPLADLPRYRLTPLSRFWLVVLRAYLLIAAGLVVFRVAQLALGHR